MEARFILAADKRLGATHVRNAGGRAMDAVRTLAVLQTIAPIHTIAVMHHTGSFPE
jgi:carbonic anhydrase